MRRDDPRESVVVVPSMTLDRVVANAGGAEPGAGGALPVLPAAAAPAAAADGLRHLAADQPVDRRVLPLAAAGRHPRPRALPALPRLGRRLAAPSRSSRRSSSRPRLIAHIRDLIPEHSLSHLVPYNTTTLERDLALLLGIPMYGADPRLFPLGTKTGCRRLFGRAGVRYPAGVEDLRSRDDLEEALARAAGRSDPTSGRRWSSSTRASPAPGNAVVAPRRTCPAPGSPQERAAVAAPGRGRWSSRTPGSTVGAYLAKLAERGGIVEERVVGDELRSPSVQMRVTPLGEVEVLSTHDQVLGGPERAVLPRLPFPRGPRVCRPHHAGRTADRRRCWRPGGRARPVRRRLRHGAARRPAGTPTPSRSTCARAAPPTPS